MVLVESCIVISLYHKTSKSLLPPFLRWASRCAAAVAGHSAEAPPRAVSKAGDSVPELSQRDANDSYETKRDEAEIKRYEAEIKRINGKWQRIAFAIDEVSRWVVPLSYAVGLACLLGGV